MPYLTTSRFRSTESPDIWDIAQEIQQQTHGKHFVGVLSFFLKLFKLFPPKPPKGDTQKKEGLGRNATAAFNISNRGYYPDLDANFGSYKVLGTYWSTAEHQGGFPHTHNIVSFGGKLFWSLTYYTHVSTFEQTQEYAQTIQQTLLNA